MPSSSKLLWTGLFFIIAVTPALAVFGLNVQKEIVVVVGAVLMAIGIFQLWNDK